jgi:UDP:flavonoid glycosyltransferase YjiC (YdhE family)
VPNIFILHSGLRGITNACLEIAKRLELDGHVVYSSSIRSSEKEVTSNQLNYIHTQALKFDYLNHSNLKFFVTAVFSKKAFFEKLIDEINFPSFEKIIKDKKIDLLLVDMELHEYIIYAQYSKVPLVLLNQFFPSLNNVLPISSKAIPKSGAQHSLLWIKSIIINIIKTLGKSLTTLGLNRRQFILYLAKKLNYNRSKLKSFIFPMPFLHMDIPVVSLTHPQLEFRQPVDKLLHYTYPMVCENRIEPVSNSFEIEFEQLLEIKSNEQKKLIVVTQSTMKGKTNKFLPKLIEALSQLDKCISIISMGDQFENFRDYRSHRNIYLYKSIPQLKVFKHADLSINHGGIHTINECIHFNLPMLIFSGNRYDQNGNAARVKKHGCGISHFSNNLSTEFMTSEINTLLNDPKYKKRLEELNTSYKKSKDHKVFENYIREKLEDIRI